MHEFGIAKSILEITEEEARKSGNRRVLRVSLRVGELGAVMPECLQFHFDCLKAGHPVLAAACLEVNRVNGSDEIIVESLELED